MGSLTMADGQDTHLVCLDHVVNTVNTVLRHVLCHRAYMQIYSTQHKLINPSLSRAHINKLTQVMQAVVAASGHGLCCPPGMMHDVQ